ncbi:MAG TPA: hypothetical protein VHW43_06270, partial [Puia sp.]|nr:hypothetical protein [Puia sp.]
AEIQTEFFKRAKALELLPGEWIPDDLPTGATIFVEEGFLFMTSYQGNRWRCINFYPEGTTISTYSEGAAEMQENSIRIRAAEPSRIYYLAAEDKHAVIKMFPGYMFAIYALSRRTEGKSENRMRLFRVPPAERAILVDSFFRYLLRAPLKDLADYLDLETDAEKEFLGSVQRLRLSPKRQLVEMHN